MKTIFYELTYSYYQYNSGAGDNGNYSKTINFTDKGEAIKAYHEILEAIDRTKNNLGSNRELADQFIPYGGYFTNAQLFESVRENTQIECIGDKEDYTNYDQCPHCYTEYDGCPECNGTGYRPLTAPSMELAISAWEWANERVDELWKDYDTVFKLNRGVYSWHMDNKYVYITAGYSCRGSVTTDEYQLPIEWLYAANRNELIESNYKSLQLQKEEQKRQQQEQELVRLKAAAALLENKLKS